MLSEWTDFFVASAGAGAALAGLLIVAVSGDVDRVIAIPGMVSRAGVAIALLVLVTLVALLALIPGLSDAGYGLIVVVAGVVAVLFASLSLTHLVRARSGGLGEALVKGALGVLPGLLITIGGVLALFGAGSGPVWVAAGILVSVIFSVLTVWVILIEIRR